MENYLEARLFEAATQGSIGSLHQLLQEDPLILERVVVNCFNETPLHVAAMLGHVDFVQEIIRLKPQLVNELNLQQASPLHLASSKGHVEVMKALLNVEGGANACFARDRSTLTPVHLAAAKGRVEAVKLLLEVRPEAARLSVNGGDKILHLCVKRYQLEVLKLLMEAVAESPEFINSKDLDGNTLLHLAVADKQVETTKYLVGVGGVDVNAVNHEGLTAMDVLIRSRRDVVRDSDIKKFLTVSGRMDSNNTAASSISKDDVNNKSWDALMNHHSNWLEKQRDSLMIVAVLIATMAFQVAVNPPGGVWQQDEPESSSAPAGLMAPPAQRAGYAVMARNYSDSYKQFYIANATSFTASLSIILLLVSGLPLRRKLFMWILMVITWIAITALALCYVIAISVLTPAGEGEKTVVNVVVITMIVWIILMALLLIAHTIRIIVKLVKKLFKLAGGGRRLNRNNIIAI